MQFAQGKLVDSNICLVIGQNSVVLASSLDSSKAT